MDSVKPHKRTADLVFIGLIILVCSLLVVFVAISANEDHQTMKMLYELVSAKLKEQGLLQ
jgi:hypothetical protein